MPLRYALLVLAAPSDPTSSTAVAFAHTLLEQGHQLPRVFFLGNGVQHANSLVTPPQNEATHATLWQDLAEQHNIELVVCISSALRRGIVDHTEAQRYQLPAHNLHPAFVIGGLGLWIEASLEADRVIRFGAG